MSMLKEIMTLGNFSSFETLINSAKNLPILLYIKNTNSEYLECNSYIATFAGLSSASDMLKTNDHDLCWKQHANLYRSNDQFVIKSNQYHVSYEPLINGNNDNLMATTIKSTAKLNNKVVGLVGLTIVHNLNHKHELFKALSQKEYICLTYYMRGKSAREIADIMFLSRRTIESHLSNIKIKLNCRNKSELLEKVFESGILRD
jgi:DNA-binding CsgD family transcriptional regulator